MVLFDKTIEIRFNSLKKCKGSPFQGVKSVKYPKIHQNSTFSQISNEIFMHTTCNPLNIYLIVLFDGKKNTKKCSFSLSRG